MQQLNSYRIVSDHAAQFTHLEVLQLATVKIAPSAVTKCLFGPFYRRLPRSVSDVHVQAITALKKRGEVEDVT